MANRKNKTQKRITKKKSVKRGGWKISPNRKSAKRYSMSRKPNKNIS